MRLASVEVRPGKVLRVEDNYGTVKLSCCGVFAEDEDPEKLPPAIPLFKTSSTSFCSPHEGDNVLVWVNKSNSQQIYYTFLGDVKSNSGKVLQYGNKDIEIVALRKDDENEDESSSLMISKEDGWKMDDAKTGLTVSKDSGVLLQHDDQKYKLKIDNDGVTLSDKKANRLEPAVLGDALEDVLNNIVETFSIIQSSSAADPYLASLSANIAPKIASIKAGISKIKSKNVKLN